MLVIGHRGARGLAPENTIAGLQKALEHHVDMLEIDLRVTRDGVVVLHHGSITKTFQDLKQRKPDLTSLEEAFKVIGHDVSWYLEVKGGEPIERIVKVIKSHLKKGWPARKLYLASKSQKTLVALHEALPELPTIVIEPWSGVRAHWRARQLGTKIVSMNQRWLWWGFIRGFKDSGWQLYAYPLNDPSKAKRWASYGLAGVVTDYPDLFE